MKLVKIWFNFYLILVDDFTFALEVINTLKDLLNLLFFRLQGLFQWKDLLLLLLFNSFEDIFFHFIKSRSELAEVFVKETSHICKNFSYLLRHCCTERGFQLCLHTFDGCFSVPLARRIERYECVLDLQNFSDDDLHFIFWIVILALNNVTFSEKLDDSIMHLDKHLSNLDLDFRNVE